MKAETIEGVVREEMGLLEVEEINTHKLSYRITDRLGIGGGSLERLDIHNRIDEILRNEWDPYLEDGLDFETF